MFYSSECPGTRNELALLGDEKHTYKELQKRFDQNCTVVDGNLEITYTPKGSSLAFLNSIKEITGYLLIFRTAVSEIRLENLEIIRGKTLFKLEDMHYSLSVFRNGNLANLSMPKLKG